MVHPALRREHSITQTERIGPMLDGSIKVIEGRATTPMARPPSTPSPRFPTTRRPRPTPCIPMRWGASAISSSLRRLMASRGNSCRTGDDPLYRHVKQVWREVGDSIAPARTPVRFFEMNLKRVGARTGPLQVDQPQ